MEEDFRVFLGAQQPLTSSLPLFSIAIASNPWSAAATCPATTPSAAISAVVKAAGAEGA